MIKKVDVLLTFPMGAHFSENVSIHIYRRFLSFIQNLLCFNTSEKCISCSDSLQCRYFQMTGKNFTEYPGILIENKVFEKQHYMQGEQKKLVFYFIGDMSSFSDYVEVFFDALHQGLFGNLFYLNFIKNSWLDEKKGTPHLYKCTTPIESIDVQNVYNKMVIFYNAFYHTQFSLLSKNVLLENTKKVSWNPIYLKTKKLNVKGYIGTFHMDEVSNSELFSIGIGRFNCIGGGHIEVEN